MYEGVTPSLEGELAESQRLINPTVREYIPMSVFSNTMEAFLQTWLKQFKGDRVKIAQESSHFGNYLMEVNRELQGQLSASDWRKYSTLLRTLVDQHQFWIPTATAKELLGSVWGLEAPIRNRSVCCRDQLSQKVALAYVRACLKAYPAQFGGGLHDCYAELMGDVRYRGVFRPLGRHIIRTLWPELQQASLGREMEAKISRAWGMVASRKDTGLDWSGPASEIPSTPESVPPSNMALDDDVEDLIRAMEAEGNRTFRALHFEELYRACTSEAIRARYGNDLLRPYLGLWTPPQGGPPLVLLCSISGPNLEGQTAYAGCKFGHSGNPEIKHQDLESEIGDVWGTVHGKARIKAVKYVEGAYGRYWINVKGHPDSLNVPFVLKNHQILLVTEEEYKRRKKVAQREMERGSPMDIQGPDGPHVFDVKPPKKTAA